MSQLFSQLGIDWHLLLSQAVNFFLLLVVLRLFVYQPLLKLLNERRRRIEEGMAKTEEADRRLHEVDAIGRGKIKEAEARAVAVLKQTESDARELEARMLAEAKRREADEMKKTDALLRAREEESRRAAEREAAALVRRAIARTVELAPEAIDDALVARAVADAKAAAQEN